MTSPVVELRACLLCGACLSACPTDAIEIVGGEVTIIDSRCDGCRACVEVCTPGALR